MITQKLVRDLFDYHEDGYLTWKFKPARQIDAGKRAGTKRPDGYYDVGINGKHYKVHRVVFLWHHGWLPTCIDHDDNDPSNNKIENLKAATRAQNCANRGLRRNNKSGFKGVYQRKETGKWRATIRVLDKKINLGHFDTPEEGYAKYCEAGRHYYGDFFNPG